MKFYNRDEERKKIQKAFEVFEKKQAIAIWIEGHKGIGKTYLLNHMAHNYEKYLFKYANNSILYKCTKAKKEHDFDYILTILVVLQNKDAKKFNRIIVEYFNSISSLTIKQGLIGILPKIPGCEITEKLFEKFEQNISNPQSAIQNIMFNQHLVKCFSDLLQLLLKDTPYIFCIDDIIWIDNQSMEVLISLINSRNDLMSFFITTRHFDDLEDDWERQQYNTIHDDLFEFLYTNNFFEIQMEDFKKNIVLEILTDFKKQYLLDNFELFYDMTGGNPLEIRNSLKYSDKNIVKKIDSYKKERPLSGSYDTRNFLSVEFVSDCMDTNLYNQTILAVLAILDIEITYTLLFNMCKKIFADIHNITFENYQFDNFLNRLIDIQEIEQNEGYRIKNDSDTEIIINNLINIGNYFDYIEDIAGILFEEGKENSFYYSILLKICCITSTTLGFDYFKQLCARNINLTASIVQYASRNFQQSFDNITSENINTYIIPCVLKKLLNYGKLEEAYSLCNILYKTRNIINPEALYIFYLIFVKILVDLGKFCNDEEYSANNIYDELCSLCIRDASKRLEVELVGMTVYEHQNRLDKISTCFFNALQIVENEYENLDSCILSKFYRNHGLIDFHANLNKKYLQAIEFTKKIENRTEKEIMYGTTMNNLGLSYFYLENIEEAIKCFEISRETLYNAGYEIVRPLNNLACCYFMLDNVPTAHDYINKALEFPFSGIFEQSCVKLNQALVLIKSKDFASAVNILDSFISEYEKNAVQDSWIYSNAFLLRGYADYLLGNYIDASKNYKKSAYHTSRFENEREQLRRQTMLKYCLTFEKVIEPFDINRILDLKNETYSFFKKPYILSLLAYYVI